MGLWHMQQLVWSHKIGKDLFPSFHRMSPGSARMYGTGNHGLKVLTFPRFYEVIIHGARACSTVRCFCGAVRPDDTFSRSWGTNTSGTRAPAAVIQSLWAMEEMFPRSSVACVVNFWACGTGIHTPGSV